MSLINHTLKRANISIRTYKISPQNNSPTHHKCNLIKYRQIYFIEQPVIDEQHASR